MGILDRFRGAREARPPSRTEPTLIRASNPENPSTNLSDPSEWLVDWTTGWYGSRFGPRVNEFTAMTVSSVYRCVALLSGVTAGLPLKVYKRTGYGGEDAPGHRLAPMLGMAPYPGRPMTAFTWRELWIQNVLLWGNHYSIIRYDGAARIIGFEPVMPWNVQVLRRGYRNMYRCVLEDESAEYVDQDDMIHIPGPGFDGIRGLSRIQSNARDAVALAKLLVEQSGRIHENAAKPAGLLEVPAGIKKEGMDRLKAQFAQAHQGWENAGKTIFVDKDTKYTPLQMSPADLNTIEFMRYQVADIARFFGLPLSLLGETEKSTSWGTGLSEQTLSFLIFTLESDLKRVESELNYKLFAGSGYYCQFDRHELLAMDPAKAAQVSQTEIAAGLLLPDEGRKYRNRPPLPNGIGQHAMVNTANQLLEALVKALTAPPAPAPALPQPNTPPAPDSKGQETKP